VLCLFGFTKAGDAVYDLWTGANPVATTASQPVTQVLADALATISKHPLCTETKTEQGNTDSLHFFIENDKVGDPSWPDDLETDLASYDQDGRPYRITVYLPQQQDDSEPDDQGPTAAERNPSMLARA
jgi:hypothetical protein